MENLKILKISLFLWAFAYFSAFINSMSHRIGHIGSRASVNIHNFNREVWLAVCNGDINILSTSEYDPNIKNLDGKTALSRAIKWQNKEVVETLLQKGANPNLADEDGELPLLRASCDGCIDIVRLLLAHGADATAYDESGRSALSLAAGNNRPEIVASLLARGATVIINKTDINGRTPLSWAAGFGNIEVVKLLLDSGARVDINDNYHQTPLIKAAGHGHLELVRLLLAKCSSSTLNHQDSSGKTALIWAAMHGYKNVVKELIGHGAEVNIKNIKGQTALHIILFLPNNSPRNKLSEKSEIIGLLVEAGADSDIVDIYGNTPRKLAEKSKYAEMIAHWAWVARLIEE